MLSTALADDLLDGAEAIANYTGLPIQRIYYLTTNHGLPHARRGMRIYARKSEIDRYFASVDEQIRRKPQSAQA